MINRDWDWDCNSTDIVCAKCSCEFTGKYFRTLCKLCFKQDLAVGLQSKWNKFVRGV